MNRSKTIFCDIDGTLWKHNGEASDQCSTIEQQLCENTRKCINSWEKMGYKIILVTGRKECLRQHTENLLLVNGIVYDQLVMNVGNGDRILINDRKLGSDRNTCYAMNVVRDDGIMRYDFADEFVTITSDQPSHVIKPWGEETLIEFNDNYVVKKLFMKANECCSLQYHKLKKETMYVVSGKLKLYYGNDIENLKTRIMNPHDHVTINPGMIHRMEGIEDSIYIETSTVEIWDVVRLQDKYARENKLEKDYMI